VLLVHCTDHEIPVVAVNGPAGVTDRYTYPHPPSVGAVLPSASVHGRPGPGQVTGASPLPGSNTNAVGVADTVADTPRRSTVRCWGQRETQRYSLHR